MREPIAERPGSDGALIAAILALGAKHGIPRLADVGPVTAVDFAGAQYGTCLGNAVAYALTVDGTVWVGRLHTPAVGRSCCHAWVRQADGRHVDPTPTPWPDGWYEGVECPRWVRLDRLTAAGPPSGQTDPVAGLLGQPGRDGLAGVEHPLLVGGHGV